jgi:hypothetical protein
MTPATLCHEAPKSVARVKVVVYPGALHAFVRCLRLQRPTMPD